MEVIKQGFLNYSNKKVFVIFSIHNDSPFLESEYKRELEKNIFFYNSFIFTVFTKKGAFPPTERIELKNSKYVGVKIRTHIDHTFDFVVILENEILSFGCKRWELMNEWVNCLKLKLRELKILSPKENFYSRPPVMRPILQQTRNPRDPLPERPQNSPLSERIPGLEVEPPRDHENGNESHAASHHEQVSQINNDNNNVTTISNEVVQEVSHIESLLVESCTIEDEETFEDSVSIPIFPNFAKSNTSSQNLINLLSNPLMRHRSVAQNSTNNFSTTTTVSNVDEFLLDTDEFEGNYDDNENEMTQIPPTSLKVEYIPSEASPSTFAENITIIPVSTESFNKNETKELNHQNGIDPSKVTKIKIEVDYDYLYKASSSIAPVQLEKLEKKKIPLPPLPSTSEIKETKSAPCTPKKIFPLAPKLTPVHEKRKSLREQQVFQLRQEIGSEIRFKLRKKDCMDAIAFVSYKDSLWIAGVKAIPQLYIFHVGDQLLAINNIANIKSNVDAQKYIKMCAGLFVEIVIRRLPLAEIFFIKREFENQCLGLIRDGNSLLDTIPNSIASRAGISARSSTTDDDDSIFWIISEINFRPLSLISHKKYDETELLLNSSAGLETSLLLQPSDFISKLRKDLKAMKNYRDYMLQ